MKVEQFMTPNPVACHVDQPAREVARLMRDKGVGSVVVLQGGKVHGIVTDRQICCEILGTDRGDDTPVGEIMTENPGRLHGSDSIFHALDVLRSAGVVRRAPVVNDYDELTGIVSISDIAVIAQDLLDAVMLEETHHALDEARLPTGGKRMIKHMRRPTKEDRIPSEPEARPVTQPSASGLPTKRGDMPRTRGSR